MQETRDFIYQQIRAFRHDAGHLINWKGIVLNAQSRPPHVKECLEAVRNEMLTEHLLEEKNGSDFLTQKGYNEIYPNIIERNTKTQVLSEQEKNDIRQRLSGLNEKLTRALSTAGDSNVGNNFHNHIDNLLDVMTKTLRELGVNI